MYHFSCLHILLPGRPKYSKLSFGVCLVCSYIHQGNIVSESQCSQIGLSALLKKRVYVYVGCFEIGTLVVVLVTLDYFFLVISI